mmetsp:Transcript_5931/g.9683  ORF Transcript_5931/g.9683 Transcript_5931/m.9683 type:complete len:209 (-) Transcript_5931:328-954(-)
MARPAHRRSLGEAGARGLLRRRLLATTFLRPELSGISDWPCWRRGAPWGRGGGWSYVVGKSECACFLSVGGFSGALFTSFATALSDSKPLSAVKSETGPSDGKMSLGLWYGPKSYNLSMVSSSSPSTLLWRRLEGKLDLTFLTVLAILLKTRRPLLFFFPGSGTVPSCSGSSWSREQSVTEDVRLPWPPAPDASFSAAPAPSSTVPLA